MLSMDAQSTLNKICWVCSVYQAQFECVRTCSSSKACFLVLLFPGQTLIYSIKERFDYQDPTIHVYIYIYPTVHVYISHRTCIYIYPTVHAAFCIVLLFPQTLMKASVCVHGLVEADRDVRDHSGRKARQHLRNRTFSPAHSKCFYLVIVVTISIMHAISYANCNVSLFGFVSIFSLVTINDFLCI